LDALEVSGVSCFSTST